MRASATGTSATISASGSVAALRNGAAIVEDELVTIAKDDCLGKIEQELDAASPRKSDSPAMAEVVIEKNRIVGLRPPAGAGQDTGNADHPCGASGQKSGSRICSIVKGQAREHVSGEIGLAADAIEPRLVLLRQHLAGIPP